MNYEMVIGLETHVELRTRTKAFCACANEYGAAPNTHVCPVCMGLPGALPMFNEEARRLAVIAGLALGCRIHRVSRFDRKNYFYPDLPKAYQITQFFHPLCEGGEVVIQTKTGEKRIGVTRIHMEEDAGKLTHGEGGTALDMNRCGVPLIEIVSEPDIRSAAEAVAYLRKLRAILTCTGVSDCRMNEGSLRCDVNLSIRRPGEPLGTRTEIKNLNSFQSVERAIQAEYQRQAAVLEAGGTVVQETRRYDPKASLTCGMRRKEDSADYRYFPEPDLPPVITESDYVEACRAAIPTLPDERRAQYLRLGLSDWAAGQLSSELWLSEYFEEACAHTARPAALANLILGEVFAQLTLRDTEKTGDRDASCLPIAPAHLARLSDLMAEGRLNSTTGKKLLSVLFDSDCDPEAYARAQDWFMITDRAALEAVVARVLERNPQLVETYRRGKTSVAQALVGKAMAETRGRADAGLLQVLLAEKLQQ